MVYKQSLVYNYYSIMSHSTMLQPTEHNSAVNDFPEGVPCGVVQGIQSLILKREQASRKFKNMSEEKRKAIIQLINTEVPSIIAKFYHNQTEALDALGDDQFRIDAIYNDVRKAKIALLSGVYEQTS